MSSTKLKVAVVGCGGVSENHIVSINDYDDADLVALVDTNADRLKELSNRYNCRFYTDYIEMIKCEKVDVIHIATPHFLHKEMIINAVKLGCHVFVEKPLALNYDEAQEINDCLRGRSEKVMVCFQNRYRPSIKMIKRIIETKELGELISISGVVTWHRTKEYYTKSDWRGKWVTEGGGVLINQAIHTLDLMQWFGGKIEGIKGHFDTRLLQDVIEVEDTAEATIRFSNGATGVFYATNCNKTNTDVRLELTFENGILYTIHNQLLQLTNGETTVLLNEDVVKGEKKYWGNQHQTIIQQFYNCLINNTEVDISLEDGSVSLEMIKGIYLSCKTKRYYAMTYMKDLFNNAD